MTNLTRTFLAAIAAMAISACSSDDEGGGRAITLYGTTFGNSELVQLDPSTGAYVRTIGAVGYRVNGLEYDHTTGKLYGTTSSNDPSFASGLIEIDLATGAGTEIGTGTGATIMNPTVNAAGEMYAWSEDSDDLVRIDKVAGTAELVGESFLDTWEHGLAFDAQDRLIFVNGDGVIFQMDTTTGEATELASVNARMHHGDVHPGTGAYWGIDETNGTADGPERTLRTVNLATSTFTWGMPTADNLFAITFAR
jgi:hypothetical protein